MSTTPHMWLDSSLPKMRRVPVHPETGQVWTERAERLCYLATCLLYEADQDPAWEEEYNSLTDGVEFREEPLFMEKHWMLGSAVKVTNPLPRVFSCHPETWEKLPAEMHAKFTLKPEREWRIAL